MKRIRYRRIHEDEIPAQKEKFASKYPWAPEPNWAVVWVRTENDSITGMVEVQQRVLVATLDADNVMAARDLIAWVDGALSMYNSYEFMVPNSNVSFQEIIERHYGVEDANNKLPCKLYIVDRDAS